MFALTRASYYATVVSEIKHQWELFQVEMLSSENYSEIVKRLNEIKQSSEHNGSNLSYLNTRSYNVPERTQSQTDSNGNRSQTQFDELGRIKTYLDASGGVTEFTYDSRDNLLEVQDPEGRSTTYSYNKNNQIISIAITGKGVISYSPYDWLQYTTLTLSGGGSISYSVDGLMRQTGRSLTKPSGEVLASYAIAYDGESNILSIDESAASLSEPKQGTYGYDKLNRLTNIQNTVENSQYGYDGVGNRTTANGGFNGKNDDLTADYNGNNQLTRYGIDTYEYDASGHTVLRLDVIGEGAEKKSRKTEYIYDAQQRLVEVKQAIAGVAFTAQELTDLTQASLQVAAQGLPPAVVGTYVYNGYGQRIRKTTLAGTVHYFYSEQGLAAEYDASGNLMVEYHYKPQSTWMTNPVTQLRDGALFFYQNDHLGKPERVLKANGEVAWAGDYSAFGEVNITTELVENNLRFPGQYFDGETGSYYNFHRDYLPSLGRYLQSDPIGLGGGLNYFGYVKGRPLKVIDPRGLFSSMGIPSGDFGGSGRPSSSSGSGNSGCNSDDPNDPCTEAFHSCVDYSMLPVIAAAATASGACMLGALYFTGGTMALSCAAVGEAAGFATEAHVARACANAYRRCQSNSGS